jgi:hypothetical protein
MRGKVDPITPNSPALSRHSSQSDRFSLIDRSLRVFVLHHKLGGKSFRSADIPVQTETLAILSSRLPTVEPNRRCGAKLVPRDVGACPRDFVPHGLHFLHLRRVQRTVDTSSQSSTPGELSRARPLAAVEFHTRQPTRLEDVRGKVGPFFRT